MFGVSITELIVIFLVALVLFGPDQLPQMARQLGKLMGDLKKGSDSVRREFYNTVYPPAQEIRRDLAASAQDLRQLRSEVLSSAAPALGAADVPQLEHPAPVEAEAKPPDQVNSTTNEPHGSEIPKVPQEEIS